jgi:hypothetical protein
MATPSQFSVGLPLLFGALVSGCAAGEGLQRQIVGEALWVAETTTAVAGATQAFTEGQVAALSGGETPTLVRPLMSLPLVEVGRYARFGSAWHRYEFARRLELGAGLPADAQCAAYWYRTAAETPRPFGRTYATEPLTPGETGIMQSQIAIRRLEGRNWTVAYAVDPNLNSKEYATVSTRCASLVLDNPAFARPPSPQW